MATTGLPPELDADIDRVTEALAMITPRWHVKIMVALGGPPLRYSDLASRLPYLRPGQLHPKLQTLCHAGLVLRTEHTARHVTYEITDRGATLLAILPEIASWAERHLEPSTRPITAVEQVEDGLALLARRHATAALWALKARGAASGTSLAATVMPDHHPSAIYPTLRQLREDGLVHLAATRHRYQLSIAGGSLGPVFSAVSAWSAGKPANAAHHTLWGRARPAVPASTRAPRHSRQAAPTTLPPTRWRHRELFSHPTATALAASLPAGNPHR